MNKTPYGTLEELREEESKPKITLSRVEIFVVGFVSGLVSVALFLAAFAP